jgi:hypothetical protein
MARSTFARPQHRRRLVEAVTTPTVLRRAGSRIARVANRDRRLGTERDAARIDALARHVPPGGVGAEIGVHKGYFTRRLLDGLDPEQLHLIDPWYLIGREWNWGLPDRSTVNALCGILHSYTDDLVSGRVALHIGWDLEILERFPDATFDWVYLDTTHSYQQTLDELRVLGRKVKPDGVIAGDDWRSDPDHHHHGVCRAVRVFLEEAPYELVYDSDDDQQWVLRREASSRA